MKNVIVGVLIASLSGPGVAGGYYNDRPRHYRDDYRYQDNYRDDYRYRDDDRHYYGNQNYYGNQKQKKDKIKPGHVAGLFIGAIILHQLLQK